MQKTHLYTKYALRSFRIISIICAIFLFFTELSNIQNEAIIKYIRNEDVSFHTLFVTIINIFSCFFFIFTAIVPYRFENLALITFAYAAYIIPFEPTNYMGILMFYLGTSLLFTRGLLKTRLKLKLGLLIATLLILFLTQLRFGFKIFINNFIYSLGGVLVLSLYSFFMQSYFINNFIYEDKKINLARYPQLNERDSVFLNKIQKGEKYYIIAKEEGLTEGSLKNRLHFVFTTLETGDKQGFLSCYSDWTIYYDSKEISDNYKMKKSHKK